MRDGYCSRCGQPLAVEQVVLAMGSDGLPLALAIMEGLGVPEVDPSSPSARLRVFCDGVEVESCVGFSRPLGKAWRHQRDGLGRLVISGHNLVIEAVRGAVTLEALS